MKTTVFITIDTEPSIAGAFRDPDKFRPLIHEPIAGHVNGRSEALGFLIRTLETTGLKATFFVEALHTRYFGDAPMGDYVKELMAAGQDVQLHIHPCWLSFEDGRLKTQTPISDNSGMLSTETLGDCLNIGCRKIERWTGVRPVALRTGNFSVSHAIYKTMNKMGLYLSSNICLGHNPPSEIELQVHSGCLTFGEVAELPVTCFHDAGPLRGGRYRPLQVTACSASELTSLLERAQVAGYVFLVIVTHPFEYIKKNNFSYEKVRVNRINQKRFRRLCEYLTEKRDKFVVRTMADYASVGSDPALKAVRNEPMLKGEAVTSLLRTAENVLNDHIWWL